MGFAEQSHLVPLHVITANSFLRQNPQTLMRSPDGGVVTVKKIWQRFMRQSKRSAKAEKIDCLLAAAFGDLFLIYLFFLNAI